MSDLSRIDVWYERDAGERVGDYILYRVRLREVALHESRNLDRMYRIFRIPNQKWEPAIRTKPSQQTEPVSRTNPSQQTEPANRASKPNLQSEPAIRTSNPNQQS
jgi:hypothetical protein